MAGHDPHPHSAGYGPLECEPISVRAPFDLRRPITWDTDAGRLDFLAALHEPLAGIELGAYDERMIAWLAGWDTPTVGTIASLLHRARAAAPLPAEGGRRS